MRRRAGLGIGLALWLAVAAGGAESLRLEIEVDGLKREGLVFAPSGEAKPESGWPLVFGFHGHGGNARQAARSFRLHEVWPEALVIYPKKENEKLAILPQVAHGQRHALRFGRRCGSPCG